VDAFSSVSSSLASSKQEPQSVAESAIELSVVIPCLNEERTVGQCVRKALAFFERRGIAGEVVVVDNGSTDQSGAVAAGAGARVVRHDVKGYGSTLKRGFQEARGTYVIMGDADDTYDFAGLDEFVRLLREGGDLVMGSRLRGKIHSGAMPWAHRHLGTPVLTFVLNLFFKARISDANCGLRGFRREAILALGLKCRGMEFASEMVIRAAQGGLRIVETPVDYSAAGPGRVPHLHTFHDGWRHLRFMLLLCPKWLFLIPGLVLFLAGLATTVLLIVKPVVLFGFSMGLSAGVFAAALMFVGLQVALLGVFGAMFFSSQGMLKEDRVVRFLRRFFSLEKGLILGGLTLLGGVVLGAVTVGMLIHSPHTPSYVNIAATRLSIVSIFVTLLGLQFIFFSFYLSLLDLNRTLE
jgi:hypothetical protein